MTPADAYLRLAMVPGLGPITAQHLLTATGSPQAVFSLTMSQLQSVRGVGGERARRIADPAGAEAVAEEQARCRRAGIRLVTRCDQDYPREFAQLADPPLAIWIKGELERRDRLALAVVGPRRPSAYGHRQAHRFSLQLAGLGTTLVSGLARGIDTVVHQAALAANGRTLAVLGSGFAHPYPRENEQLLEEIAAGNGAVISEYPLDSKPTAGSFPRRNRLVAALSLAALIIEAGKRSGALITARLSGELGHEVMVLPGPIDRPEHQGANQLIRDGATLVTSVEEVLQEVDPLLTLNRGQNLPAIRPEPELNGRERQVYGLLSDEPRSVDDIHRVCRLPASSISATLISLELRRLARKQPGGYVRAL